MTHNWDNATWIPHRGNSRPEKCFYKGRVRGDDRSTVAVSLCDGMVRIALVQCFFRFTFV